MIDAMPRPESGDQRRARILARLHEIGVLSVADLARELGVSHMTVRRDLHRLEAAGQVRTVHGGVGLAGADHVRRGVGCDEVAARRLARRAAQLVAPGDTVALDAGPVAYALARVLAGGVAGTVITHSMPVMQVLAERDAGAAGPRLVALGGELTHARQALVGPTTLDAIAGLRARVFFLDAAAVDARGTYACSTPEARVSRGLTGIADRVVLLAGRQAVRGSAPALVAGLDQLDVAVVDEPPSGPLATAFARAGVTVHIAQP
jgi:DeoR/GlpR family transcriptional regulator of sugar metabolism